jgi:predicted GIY-YIG superfamily endonuclease
MNPFHYVYVLVSEADETRHYTGIIENLENRLKSHNNGQVPHTSQFSLWRIKTAVEFRDRSKALAFEKYLKSHSGRAFASKHF